MATRKESRNGTGSRRCQRYAATRPSVSSFTISPMYGPAYVPSSKYQPLLK